MGKSTRKLTLAALFSALAVVMLYVATLWPTGQLGLAAVASLFVVAAVIESGLVSGLSVYIVSSLIAFLIVPNKAPVILFVLFFGYYPILKSLIEKRMKLVWQIIAKLAVFNISSTVAGYFLMELMLASINDENGRVFTAFNSVIEQVIIYVIGSLVFLLFDYGMTKLIWFYINRISKNIPK